ADRGHFQHHGAGDGGDGAGGAGDGEGGRGGGDRRHSRHAQDGGDGGGEVPQAAGRGAGGGQCRVSVAGHRQGRSGARAGAGQAGLDQTPQKIQGGSLCSPEGRGGAAHPVLQRVPAAVLLSDDGRGGGGDGARGGG